MQRWSSTGAVLFAVEYGAMVTTRSISRSFGGARRLDRGQLALLLTFVLLLPIFTPRLYATDSVQYYAYLRSLFFDSDLDFRNEYTRFNELNPGSGIDKALLPRVDPGTGIMRNVDPTTGKLVNVAPVGTAILWTPAFLIAHGVVLLADALGATIPADGYSAPYIWAISFASAVYGLLGVLISYRIARRFVGVWPATAATITCWLASPLVFYMYVSPPWSHTASLFATALFIWYWLHTQPNRSRRQWLALALIGGLMTMTREQLGFFLLLPALEALVSYAQLLRERRWRTILQSLTTHGLFLAVFLLAITPQLVTYKVLNGRLGPSKVVAQKLDLSSSPHFFDTLIDVGPSPITGQRFAHGAFVWTPVWALGSVGLLLLWRRERRLMALLLLAFGAQVYINGAFGTTWHLSGAFGFRRLIEVTPIFVLGVALLIERVRFPRPAQAIICALLIAWNFGLIYQWAVLGSRDRAYREGLVWNGMLQRQLSMPIAAAQKLDQLLFNRGTFYDSGGGQK